MIENQSGVIAFPKAENQKCCNEIFKKSSAGRHVFSGNFMCLNRDTDDTFPHSSRNRHCKDIIAHPESELGKNWHYTCFSVIVARIYAISRSGTGKN